MNIERWVKTNRLTDEQLAIANELNERGIETFTDAVFSIGEPALAIISSSIAEPIAGLAGLGMAAFEDVNSGVKTIEQVKNALSYQPRTRGGKTGMEFVADTLQPVSDAFTAVEDYLGDNTLELTGSPLLAAGAATIPAAIAELNPLGKASKQATKMDIFAGKKAKTADLNKQAMAEELLNRGMDRDTIWKETGWFKDVDDHWKFEIDDSQTQITSTGLKSLNPNEPYFRGEFGGFIDHAHMRANYPEIEGYSLRGEMGDGGSFLQLDDSPITGKPMGEFGIGTSVGELPARSTALHEAQHAIQGREGFAKGGSAQGFADEYNKNLHNLNYFHDEKTNAILKARKTPEYLDNEAKINKALDDGDKNKLPDLLANRRRMEADATSDISREIIALEEANRLNPFEKYQRLAGEAEARNVESRLNMTPEERAATPPWKTLDVPEDELILKDVSGLAMSEGELSRAQSTLDAYIKTNKDRLKNATPEERAVIIETSKKLGDRVRSLKNKNKISDENAELSKKSGAKGKLSDIDLDVSISPEGVVKYYDKSSGAVIELLDDDNALRKGNITKLFVPEDSRGRGVANTLLSKVMKDYPSLMGQVSSKKAALNAYRSGRRLIDDPSASFDDIINLIDERGSVNMATSR